LALTPPEHKDLSEPMRQRVPVLTATALILAACQATSPTGSPSLPADPSPTATVAVTPAAIPTSGATSPTTADPVPSADLPPFACDFPIEVAATAAGVANIVDVRVGTHDGYDRVVFEFNAGTPELTLDEATPPFVQDGSGFPIDVEGDAVLGLVMRGGTKQTESGASSYDGPTDFDPGFPRLVDLVEGGDFEAQSTWYLGLNAEACARAFLLTGPDRLVIDVEH